MPSQPTSLRERKNKTNSTGKFIENKKGHKYILLDPTYEARLLEKIDLKKHFPKLNNRHLKQLCTKILNMRNDEF